MPQTGPWSKGCFKNLDVNGLGQANKDYQGVVRAIRELIGGYQAYQNLLTPVEVADSAPRRYVHKYTYVYTFVYM